MMVLTKNLVFFLIDDDEDDRDLFQMALEDMSEEIEFTSAKNGIVGLNTLKENKIKPDFIFLDLNMPEMSGRECLAELKSNEITKSIPVVIFSTSSDAHDIAETNKMGAIDFITKPSKVSELTSSLTHFLSKQKKT
ncbi:MAG: phoB [Bacteroidetes bacterium]|nr:phoB [Bacteroidota bacterium]